MEAAEHGLSDSEIIARVRAGERTLYAEIIRRYQSRLRTVLSFYAHAPQQVEEFLQETLVEAYTSLHAYDAAAPFYPWLKGIALNTLRMEFRRLQTNHRRGADYLRFVQLQKIETYAEALEIEPRAEALRGCLNKLPAADAELVRAKYADAAPLKALAQKLETTEGALKVRLLRIRNALRLCIQRQLAVSENA